MLNLNFADPAIPINLLEKIFLNLDGYKGQLEKFRIVVSWSVQTQIYKAYLCQS